MASAVQRRTILGGSKPIEGWRANELERKCAERDELSGWLSSLESALAPDLEAIALVRAQLERVVSQIAGLRECNI